MKLNFIDQSENKIVLDIQPSANIRDIRLMLLRLTGKIENIELEGKLISFTDNKSIQEYQLTEQNHFKLIPITNPKFLSIIDLWLNDDSDLHPSNNNLSECIDFDNLYEFNSYGKHPLFSPHGKLLLKKSSEKNLADLSTDDGIKRNASW